MNLIPPFDRPANAPERSRVFLDGHRGQVRTVQIPVTTQSRIPIVLQRYRYEDPFDRPERYLTFKGWDAETGLMVFDR